MGDRAGAAPGARSRRRERHRHRHRAAARRPRAHRAPRGRHPQPGARPADPGDRRRHRSSTPGSSGTPRQGKPARALHDINVIGTLQLLAACERSPTIERVVVRGSAAIYGCEPAGPSFFTEEMARELPAADPVPAGHRRARGLLRELRPPPLPPDLLHAPLPARDRPRAAARRWRGTCRCRPCRPSSASTRGCS